MYLYILFIFIYSLKDFCIRADTFFSQWDKEVCPWGHTFWGHTGVGGKLIPGSKEQKFHSATGENNWITWRKDISLCMCQRWE